MTESSAAIPGATAGVNGEAAPGRGPVVIYIAGSGRSGSTLLERAIGEIPGFVNVGELIDLFRRTISRSENCGCGKPFRDCEFWHEVGERAYGGWDSLSLPSALALARRVARQRHLPKLLLPAAAGQEFRADLARYGENYARLYGAIAAVAGADYVVDASKWPVQALALARGGLDVRVIHLIRDIRGVTYSHGKKNVSRPHAPGQLDMKSHPPAGAAARWVACQAEAELLRGGGTRVTRVRYEDFVSQPRPAMTAALSALGIGGSPAQLSHVGDTALTLGASHGLSGNPTRFSAGTIALRADTAWRDGMSRRDRALVTAIGLPFMIRYAAAGPKPMARAGAGD